MKRRHLLGSLGLLVAPCAWALYEPEPIELFKPLPGHWRGSLVYRDWSAPHALVRLPCTLFASLNSPSQASLYFVFQDGPGKVVYSYDRWTVSGSGDELAWASGKDVSTYAIAPMPSDRDAVSVMLTRQHDGKTHRQTLRIAATSLHIDKVEIAADGSETFRNRYEFRRTDP